MAHFRINLSITVGYTLEIDAPDIETALEQAIQMSPAHLNAEAIQNDYDTVITDYHELEV